MKTVSKGPCDCSPDCPILFGTCHCGCGAITGLHYQSVTARGVVKGTPKKFINEHQNKRPFADFVEWPDKMCGCGCGQFTKRTTKTQTKFGYIKGKPLDFINGHQQRKIDLDTNAYVEEDRGYDTPCWIWQWCVSIYGYGIYQGGAKKNQFVHRVFYERKYGKIPSDLRLDHLCRVRFCCNPDHLEPVTSGENVRRGSLAKLDWDKVISMREMGASGQYTCEGLAETFNVSSHTIARVLCGLAWTDENAPIVVNLLHP